MSINQGLGIYFNFTFKVVSNQHFHVPAFLPFMFIYSSTDLDSNFLYLSGTKVCSFLLLPFSGMSVDRSSDALV